MGEAPAVGGSAVLRALYAGDHTAARRLATAASLDLFEAAALGDVRRIAELDPDSEAANSRAPDGYTPLHLAAYFDRPHVATLLLRSGASPGRLARTSSRVQPLHSAVAGRSTGVSCLLLYAGAAVDPTQDGGYTPLHEAAISGDGGLAELLLAYGADPRRRTDDGRIAADLATAGGHVALAARLTP